MKKIDSKTTNHTNKGTRARPAPLMVIAILLWQTRAHEK